MWESCVHLFIKIAYDRTLSFDTFQELVNVITLLGYQNTNVDGNNNVNSNLRF